MNVNKLRFQNRTTGKEKFSLLLVGPSDFCRIMSDHISATNKKLDHFPLSISTSESIELIVKSSESLHVDFIVFLMNTAHRHCLEIVERSICLVDPIYLCDKMVFVNGCNQLKPSSMGLTHDELFNLTQKYRLHMFHGNIKNDCSCINLAKRVLNFMAAVCGAFTSVPMIMDFPTDRYPAS